MKTSGIYMIKNKVNGKVYIGQSGNINRRWSMHISQLNSGSHYNVLLQRSWDKYSQYNFEFKIIEECNEDSDALNIREIYWAKQYNSHNREFGHNLAECGGYRVNKFISKTEVEMKEIGLKMSDKRNENLKLRLINDDSLSYNRLDLILSKCTFKVSEPKTIKISKHYIEYMNSLNTQCEIYLCFMFIIYKEFFNTTKLIFPYREVITTGIITSKSTLLKCTERFVKDGFIRTDIEKGWYTYYNVMDYDKINYIELYIDNGTNLYELFANMHFKLYSKKEMRRIFKRNLCNNILIGYEPIMVEEINNGRFI